MPRKDIHVVPDGSGSAVEAEGSPEGRQVYTSQDEAIAAGTKWAKQEKLDFLVYAREGHIRMRNSFSKVRASSRGDALLPISAFAAASYIQRTLFFGERAKSGADYAARRRSSPAFR